MTNTAIAILLVLILAGGAWGALKKLRKGSGCCGTHEETVARISPVDRNKRHYPYEVSLSLGGMTCENCARKVENALNALEGVWADVSIDSRTARVRTKEPPQEALLRQAVQQSGYVVTAYTEAKRNAI